MKENIEDEWGDSGMFLFVVGEFRVFPFNIALE